MNSKEEGKLDLLRPRPIPDGLSEPFWQGVNSGKLLVQRCTECKRFHYPPKETCHACGSDALSYEEVSGKGTVESFTLVSSGARHPFFRALSPYFIGRVELDEQEGLYMYTNFPGATENDLATGARVEVEFERIDEDSAIPQFRVVGGRQ